MVSSNGIREWLVGSAVLTRVAKPSRYIGKELNSVVKVRENKLRMLLAFPDTYEIGLSHLGFKILYKELNDRENIYAERAYLPWKDMLEEMKKAHIPLFSLETYSPAEQFHIIGITLQYELGYTNVLALLDLAGIPLLQSDRTSEPIILGGGPCASNPEPTADFFDAYVIGDGEGVTINVCETIQSNLQLLHAGKRQELLKLLGKIRGVYVPSLGKKKVIKALIEDISNHGIDKKPVVPYMKVVHDRSIIEVMRGCNRGCRFCQAGMFYRPVRERRWEEVLESLKVVLENTGYEEVSFLSLSTMDYSEIAILTDHALPVLEPQRVALSLPSSRVDAFGVEVASKIASIKKTGLTFAPEAGTQRLRNVINKNVTQEDLLDCAKTAKKNGWQRLKLYFMMGLPTETKEDIEGIIELSQLVKSIGFKELSVSVSIFIPKPHTPFQFARQIDEKEAHEKATILKSFSGRGIKIKVHDPDSSTIEGILSRGDKELGKVILKAYQMGAVFDEWDEQFKLPIWEKAFAETGLDKNQYMKGYSLSEELPWEHISIGVSKSYLVAEYLRALEGKQTPDCRWDGCTGCSVCQSLRVSNVIRRI